MKKGRFIKRRGQNMKRRRNKAHSNKFSFKVRLNTKPTSRRWKFSWLQFYHLFIFTPEKLSCFVRTIVQQFSIASVKLSLITCRDCVNLQLKTQSCWRFWMSHLLGNRWQTSFRIRRIFILLLFFLDAAKISKSLMS